VGGQSYLRGVGAETRPECVSFVSHVRRASWHYGRVRSDGCDPDVSAQSLRRVRNANTE
jgi:hypothetical protein